MKKPKKKIFRVSGGLVFILMLTFITAGFVLAEEKHWIGGPSDWNVPGNWDDEGVPRRGDSVRIDQTGDQVSYNNPLNPTLRSLLIDDPANTNPGHPTILHNALTLTTEKTEIGRTGGRSIYNQSGGTHRILIGNLYNNTDLERGNLLLGSEAGSFGSYELLDAVLSVAGHEKIGVSGIGQLDQANADDSNSDGATLQCAPPVNPPPVTPPPLEPVHSIGKNLYLGVLEGSDGSFNIESGSLTVGGSIRIANFGTGMFNQTKSAVTVKGNDPDPLKNGALASEGGEFLSIRRMKGASAPSLECHNTTSKHPGLIVGVNNQGTYQLTDGTLAVNYSEIIGWGAGSDFSWFFQTNGSHKINGNLIIARHSENTYNSFTIKGTSIYDSGDLPLDGLVDVGGFASVAYLGSGDFAQTGGKVKVRGIDPELVNLSLRTAYTPGTPTLQCSPSPKNYIGLTVGRGGTGIYYFTNGELLVSRGAAVGVFDKSDGTFYHNSGSHYVGGALTIALVPGSKGLYEFYDGLLVARGGLVNNDTFNLYGGVLQAKVINNSQFRAGKPDDPLPGQPAPAVIGDFYNQEKATLTLSDTKVKFEKNFYNSGTVTSANATSISTPTFKNLTINESGVLKLGLDEVTVTGNLTNKSSNPLEWDTDSATLAFSGVGTHYFKPGNNASGDWDGNFGWGALSVPSGALLRLQGHLYAKKINVQADGERITNMFGYCGIGIFNHPDNPGFPELAGKKLYNPWGRQVGHFSDTGLFIQDCL